ncbi:unnamed protein product [Amoebophrya sp. A120]|nr:unnamed protein product [Amoebophrya sp. A120]CAD7975719.1 unnamed protein product [Amoebophrya sp. A120]|eukprot:GSA120T00026198001.1
MNICETIQERTNFKQKATSSNEMMKQQMQSRGQDLLFRQDGRLPTELRPPIINRSKTGSCTYKLGGTLVVAKCFGPKEKSRFASHGTSSAQNCLLPAKYTSSTTVKVLSSSHAAGSGSSNEQSSLTNSTNCSLKLNFEITKSAVGSSEGALAQRNKFQEYAQWLSMVFSKVVVGVLGESKSCAGASASTGAGSAGGAGISAGGGSRSNASTAGSSSHAVQLLNNGNSNLLNLDISLHVFEFDGSLLPACINATSVALADLQTIEIKELVAGVNLGLVSERDNLLVRTDFCDKRIVLSSASRGNSSTTSATAAKRRKLNDDTILNDSEEQEVQDAEEEEEETEDQDENSTSNSDSLVKNRPGQSTSTSSNLSCAAAAAAGKATTTGGLVTVVDMTEEEESWNQSVTTVATNLKDEILLLHCGRVREEKLLRQFVELGQEGCGKIRAVMREALLNEEVGQEDVVEE